MVGVNGDAARDRMDEWMTYVQSSAGTAWVFGKCWDEHDGWRLMWKVGGRAMLMGADFADRMAASMRESFKEKFAAMPRQQRRRIRPDEMFAMVDDMENQAKECVELIRTGQRPAAVGGTYSEPVTLQ